MRLSLINYFGGKYYVLDKILKKLRYDVDLYIEPFGGSFKVLLNKEPHKREIINDINEEIITLFQVIRDNLDEFLERLDKFLLCEKEFYDVKKRLKENKYTNKIDKAVDIYLKNRLSFNSLGKSFAIDFTRYLYKRAFENNFKEIRDRLKKVLILNRDYKYLLEALLKRNFKAMIYLDPPYIDIKEYEFNFNLEEHYRLSDYLHKLYDKHYILLSYKEHKLLEKLYPRDKWNYTEIECWKFSKYISDEPERKREKYKEYLITNY